jgi:hypothetical protein
MLSADDGLAAIAYAPCEVETMVRNTPVQIREETEYPFAGKIRLTVHAAAPISFPLRLRIPSWAVDSKVSVNGVAQGRPEPGSFYRLDRKWVAGDVVDLEFPMAPRVSRGFHRSATVEAGPLVFAFGIGEEWLKLRDRGMTHDWQVYPTTPWNYAIAAEPEMIKVAPNESAVAAEGPFTRRGSPLKLQVRGHRVPAWLSDDNVADPVPESPVKPEGSEEIVTMIPYAVAKLRITAFPVLAFDDAKAHEPNVNEGELA